MLGSVSLSVSDNGGSRDFFVARLTDPDTVRAELKIARIASGLALSWPVSSTGFVLESADSLPTPTWTAVPVLPVLNSDQNLVTNALTSSHKFFRLRKP
jgi:hypothetical protein